MYNEVIKFTSVFINVSFAFYTVNDFFDLFFQKKCSRLWVMDVPMSMYLLWQVLVSVYAYHPTIVLGISVILIWLHILAKYNNGNTVAKLGLVTLYVSIWTMSEIISKR